MRTYIASCAARLAAKARFRMVEGTGGVPLHVTEIGDPARPTLLLIHGLAQSSLSWIEQLLSDLGEQFHIVAFDLRGHGASGKPWLAADYTGPDANAGDVAAVIKALDLKDVTAVAWSYGGYVLADYVRVHGLAAIAKINLVGTLAAMVERSTEGFPTGDALKEQQRMAMSENPLEVVQANFGQADFVTGGAVTAELQYLIEFTANQLPTYAKKAMMGRPRQNLDIPALITCPVLLSVGDKDWTVPKASIANLLQQIPTARVSTYQGAGHAPFLEDPARFNAELRAFVLETTPAS